MAAARLIGVIIVVVVMVVVVFVVVVVRGTACCHKTIVVIVLVGLLVLDHVLVVEALGVHHHQYLHIAQHAAEVDRLIDAATNLR